MIKFFQSKTGAWVAIALGILLAFGGYAAENMGNRAKGKMLIATARANAPFKDTIIYVHGHSIFGAFGFVVNKKGYGGPVEPEERIAFYVNDRDEIDFLDELKEGDPVPAGAVVVHGYAAWGFRQLDRELDAGVWVLAEPDRAVIFSGNKEDEPADGAFMRAGAGE